MYRPFTRIVRVVVLDPTKGTHSVAWMDQIYFGAPPLIKLSKFTKKFTFCLSSDYKLQGVRRICKKHCRPGEGFYILCLIKVLKGDF